MKIGKVIQSIESEFEVEKVQYKGLPLWLEIRNRFFFKLSIGKETNLKVNASLAFSLLQAVFYGFFNWFRSYDAWFLGSGLNRVLLDGKYYDKLFDYPAQRIGKSLFIELSTQKTKKRNTIASKYIVSRAPLIVLEKMFSLFFNIKKVDQTIIEEIIKKYEIDYKPDYAIKKMVAQYRVMKLLLRLKKVPKVVFIAPSYTAYGFIRAFKEKGVKVVEVQHGVINGEHFGYNVYQSFDRVYFPDYLLSFGEREKRVFESPNLSIRQENIFPVGSFYIEHVQNNYPKSVSNDGQLIFSVSLQDCDIGQKLIPFLIEVARDNSNFSFLLKPRRTTIEEYLSLYDFPENMSLVGDKNVYETIMESHIHITAYSSCALEAPAMGRKNILVNFENKAIEYYGAILGKETTSYISTKSEFETVVAQLTFNPEQVRSDHKDVIVSGYKNNIDRFLNELGYE